MKAGLSDVAILRSATLEQLTAVPGMSEIKARHILEFLGQFSADTLNAAVVPQDDSAKPVVRPSSALDAWPESPESKPGNVALWISTTPGLPATVIREGEQALNLAFRLLLTESATGYRARLLRETIGFMHLVQGLLQCALPETKSQERAIRRLQSVSLALLNAITASELDRKAQTRLADELAQAGDRLESLIGQTIRRRLVETDDE